MSSTPLKLPSKETALNLTHSFAIHFFILCLSPDLKDSYAKRNWNLTITTVACISHLAMEEFYKKEEEMLNTEQKRAVGEKKKKKTSTSHKKVKARFLCKWKKINQSFPLCSLFLCLSALLTLTEWVAAWLTAQHQQWITHTTASERQSEVANISTGKTWRKSGAGLN